MSDFVWGKIYVSIKKYNDILICFNMFNSFESSSFFLNAFFFF